MRNGNLVGLAGSKRNIRRSEVIGTSHFLVTIASGGFENSVLIQIDPDRCIVIPIGDFEPVVAILRGIEIGNEQIHVIVILSYSYAGVLEIAITVKAKTIVPRIARFAGNKSFGISGRQSPKGLKVVEVTCVGCHMITPTGKTIFGFFPKESSQIDLSFP